MEEFEKVRQDATGFKRYFYDEEFDLYVWYKRKGGDVTGLQLVYDKATEPRALTWIKGKGYRHNRIDGYDSRRYVSLAPVLVADGILDPGLILERFRIHSGGVDPDIVALVEEVLTAYNPLADDQSV